MVEDLGQGSVVYSISLWRTVEKRFCGRVEMDLDDVCLSCAFMGWLLFRMSRWNRSFVCFLDCGCEMLLIQSCVSLFTSKGHSTLGLNSICIPLLHIFFFGFYLYASSQMSFGSSHECSKRYIWDSNNNKAFLPLYLVNSWGMALEKSNHSQIQEQGLTIHLINMIVLTMFYSYTVCVYNYIVSKQLSKTSLYLGFWWG